jgi:hypothetical protein
VNGEDPMRPKDWVDHALYWFGATTGAGFVIGIFYYLGFLN